MEAPQEVTHKSPQSSGLSPQRHRAGCLCLHALLYRADRRMLWREVRLRWRACTLRLLALCLAALLCTHFSAELKRRSLPQPGLLAKEPGAEVYNRRAEEVPSKRQVIYVRRSSKGASYARQGGNAGVRRRDTLQVSDTHWERETYCIILGKIVSSILQSSC